MVPELGQSFHIYKCKEYYLEYFCEEIFRYFRDIVYMYPDLSGQSINSRYYSLESDRPEFKFKLC